MQTCSASLRLLLLPLTAMVLAGCGKGDWLTGTWTLDKDRTLAELTRDADSSGSNDLGEGLLSDLAGGVEKGIFRLLLTQFEGVEIEITPAEIKRTRDGVGEIRKYEINDSVEKDVYILKIADGGLETWARTDTGVRMKLNTEGDNWIYFQPVE